MGNVESCLYIKMKSKQSHFSLFKSTVMLIRYPVDQLFPVKVLETV